MSRPCSFSRYWLYFLFFIALLIFFFNIYYFFIRRDVGIAFYINKVIHKAKDNVLLTPDYRDLVDQYYYLNQGLSGKRLIVFLGDSNTKRFNVYEHFPDLPTVNRGINSDTTIGILKRLDRNIGNLKIDKLFLLIGFNDLQYQTNDEILANIELIVKRINAHTIYLQSLLPVDAEKKEINHRIVEVNEALRRLCLDKGITYIDLHSYFLDEKGGLSKKYSFDGTHLNGGGHQLWRELIGSNL